MRKECDDWFGYLTMLEANVQMKPKPKPHILIYLEQMRALQLPLYAGGIMDQPYIFMQMLAEAMQSESLYLTLRNQNAEGKDGR